MINMHDLQSKLTEINNVFNLKVEKVVQDIKGMLELEKSVFEGNIL